MFIEGVIDKEHLELMKLAGYEFEWEIVDEEQWKSLCEKRGKAFGPLKPIFVNEGDDDLDFTTHAYVRYWMDRGIEEHETAFDLVHALEEKDLPLLVGMKNKEIQEAVADRLRGTHA
jgi:hypothetical protein